MMKKSLFPLVVLLTMMLLIPSIAVVECKTTTSHINGKGAYAPNLSDGSSTASLSVMEVEVRPPSPQIPSGILMQGELFDAGSGNYISLNKELMPSEFKWSYGACRVLTEVEGYSLTVKWETLSPTEKGYSENSKFETFLPPNYDVWGILHLISNMIGREAVVTLTWKGLTLVGEGAVSHINTKNIMQPMPRGKIPAALTGTIDDYGLDLDGNQRYDSLVVAVEVSVRTPGIYTLAVDGLLVSSRNMIGVYGEATQYLDRGTHSIEVLLDGPTIYASGLNPSMVASIDLFDEMYNQLGSLSTVSLSREYMYDEFEMPPALLIGIVSDEGADPDSDGAFDYLQVDVGVVVNTAGTYSVEAYGLLDTFYNYIPVDAMQSVALTEGMQVVTLSFEGSTIYASGVNPSMVASIYLYDEMYTYLGSMDTVSLSREYMYDEFEMP